MLYRLADTRRARLLFDSISKDDVRGESNPCG
jgi:hypothetical protein